MANIQPISEDVGDFHKNRCVLVKNILDKDLCKFISIQGEFDHLRAPKQNSDQVFGSQEMYDSLSTKILNAIFLEKIKNILGLESIYTTYGFYRKYHKFQELVRHTDRPECEISISICLDMHQKNKPWEIFFENEKQGTIYSGKPEVGDGIIYMGEELPHWREKCTQKWVKQIFLHYSSNWQLEYDLKNSDPAVHPQLILTGTLIKTLSENY